MPQEILWSDVFLSVSLMRTGDPTFTSVCAMVIVMEKSGSDGGAVVCWAAKVMQAKDTRTRATTNLIFTVYSQFSKSHFHFPQTI